MRIVVLALIVIVFVFVSACVIPVQQRPPAAMGGPPEGEAAGPPASHGEVDPHLVGCWEWYNYRDQQTGTESYRGRLELRADASFSWRAYPWASSADKGLPEFNERGQWGVSGNALALYSERGRPMQRAISFEDDSFHLDGIKQFTCR
jgi:hypothetical protein